MCVHTVRSCVKQRLTWSVMFVFTLVQSRTHVDTVQNVSNGFTNSRHICWSHTMKVLDWHVTFVRRSSAKVVTLRHQYVDMKVWSHMSAVNVQSASVRHMNWEVITLYIWTISNSAVVCVTKVSNVKRVLKCILRNVLLWIDCDCLDFVFFYTVHCNYYTPWAIKRLVFIFITTLPDVCQTS